MHPDTEGIVARIAEDKRCPTTNTPELDRVREALDIMLQVGIDARILSPRQAEKCAFALLALADVAPESSLRDAKGITNWHLGTREVIFWAQKHYGETRKDSGYDYVLRNDLKPLLRSGYAQNTGTLAKSSYNDSTRGYGLSEEFAALIRRYGTDSWDHDIAVFMTDRLVLKDLPQNDGELVVRSVGYHGASVEIDLLPGGHNSLIKQSVEEFLPRYGHDARLVYLGDADIRDKFIDRDTLAELGIDFEDLLPDVVAVSKENGWLFIIEAVHSRGPVSHDKHRRFEDLLQSYPDGVVYVTTFKSREKFRRNIDEIAWETEVWIADEPDHLVHFNGDKFLGPHS